LYLYVLYKKAKKKSIFPLESYQIRKNRDILLEYNLLGGILMKYTKMVLIVVLAAVLAFPVFGAPTDDIGELQKGFGNLTETFGKSLIFNSTLGLAWSDAYIGQLIGKPPHFGVGLSVGATSINLKDLDPFFKALDVDVGDIMPVNFVPFPGAAAEIRIGGFLLPFDIGIRALPLPAISFGDGSIRYTLFGADVRYAVIKEKGFLPDLSVGFGFRYQSGKATYSTGGTSFSFDKAAIPGLGSGTIGLTDPEMDFHWKNTTLDLKVQVSKHLLFITPYLGLGASYGWSTVGYGLNSSITGLVPGDREIIKNYLASIGAPGIDLDDNTGVSSESKFSGFAFRAFGGISFDIAVIRIDFTGLYNFSNGNFGANVGFRFQL
jgi:hypothetical protein